MNSSRPIRITDEKYSSLLTEYNILKCKCESKSEAIQILTQELAQCQAERDQFKLMADQLRERYSALKRQVEGWGPSLMGVYDVRGLKGDKEKSLAMFLCELKEQNRAMQRELEDVNQKHADAQGDVKVLREHLAQQRSGSLGELSLKSTLPTFDQDAVVKQLELVQHKYSLLERDLEAILDEKEELVTSRDAYKHKVERLNQQMNAVIRGENTKLIDIDCVIMENRYLNERLKQTQEEMKMLTSGLSKYKALLEKKRTGRGGVRLTTSAGTFALSSKHVQQILQTNPLLELPSNPSSPADLRILIMALFETLNDKTLALSHQKKTNKILGNRVTELEKHLKSLGESACWSPRRVAGVINRSESSPAGDSSASSAVSDAIVAGKPSIADTNYIATENKKFNAVDEEGQDDLDLLPTKEIPVSESRSRSSSGSHSNSDLHISLPNSPLLKSSFQPQASSVSSPNLTMSPTSHLDLEPDPNVSKTRERTVSNSSDIDEDLPPQLQKLLAAALADMEKETSETSHESHC